MHLHGGFFVSQGWCVHPTCSSCNYAYIVAAVWKPRNGESHLYNSGGFAFRAFTSGFSSAFHMRKKTPDTRHLAFPRISLSQLFCVFIATLSLWPLRKYVHAKNLLVCAKFSCICEKMRLVRRKHVKHNVKTQVRWSIRKVKWTLGESVRIYMYVCQKFCSGTLLKEEKNVTKQEAWTFAYCCL